MLASLALILPMPFLSISYVDKIFQNLDSKYFVPLLFAWFVVVSIKVILDFSYNYILQKHFLVCITKIRTSLLRHVISLPVSYFKNHQSGYILSRVFQDSNEIVNILLIKVFSAVNSIISLAVGGVMLFYINWKLALISVLIVPVFLLPQKLFNKKIRLKHKKNIEAWDMLRGRIQEIFSGVYNVKLNTAENLEIEKISNQTEIANKLSLDEWKTIKYSQSVSDYIQIISPILIISCAVWFIMFDRLTIGEFIGYIGYVGFLFGPATKLFGYFISFQNALVALDRINKIKQFKSEESLTTSLHRPKSFIEKKAKLVFEDVYFRYPENKNNQLTGISFHLNEKQHIGIIGSSGAGKTSIVNLLLRILDLQKGNIYVDGVDILQMDIYQIRKMVYLVTSEPYLFTGSIIENITYSAPESNQIEVFDAIINANAEFIYELPDKQHTIIGEKGLKLSAGQRQKISIARAFLRKPEILIFDEATSSIDSKSENEIKIALKKLFQNRSSIIISHRKSSIVGLDKVIIIENGVILEDASYLDVINSEKYKKTLR